MTKRIVFTGGGTAGHVTPNMPLISALLEEHWEVFYIGSHNSVEEKLIKDLDVPFYSIQSGKLRRYFSLKNFLDPFKVVIGIIQALKLMLKLRPAVVFSKGGFVAFPVVFAAWLCRIPVIAHESDMTPGLANRLSFPFATKVCLTFEATAKYFKSQDKIKITGTPIRDILFQGTKQQGFDVLGFKDDKPCLLVIGGSLGATSINHVVRLALPKLLENYHVIHLCGPGKVDEAYANKPGYSQIDYAKETLPHLFAVSDIVISRSGANSVCELLALKKPHILIPLPLSMSRGDQIHNARFFEKLGASVVLDEEKLNLESLIAAIDEVMNKHDALVAKMTEINMQSATLPLLTLIKETAHV